MVSLRREKTKSIFRGFDSDLKQKENPFEDKFGRYYSLIAFILSLASCWVLYQTVFQIFLIELLEQRQYQNYIAFPISAVFFIFGVLYTRLTFRSLRVLVGNVKNPRIDLRLRAKGKGETIFYISFIFFFTIFSIISIHDLKSDSLQAFLLSFYCGAGYYMIFKRIKKAKKEEEKDKIEIISLKNLDLE